MYNLIKPIYLRFLRVPPEPNDPFGDEDSVRVFRASPNYLKYKLILWGIGISVLGLIGAGLAIGLHIAAFAQGGGGAIILHLLALAVWALLAFLVFLSYMGVRLEYEMRWYKVSDRALRIREGVWFVREMTMTFANIQNLAITQGPIQRYFSISDLKVQTAGGGGSVVQNQKGADPIQFQMHIGYFRGVDNAEEIRNLIRERLRQLRDAGLGDTDEARHAGLPGAAPMPGPGVFDASGEVLAELRALGDEARAFRAAAESARR